MKLLLDTHVWLWLVARSDRLGSKELRRIDEASRKGDLFVSPISAWEVATLDRKGRIRLRKPVAQWVDEALTVPGLNLAAFTPAIAVASCQLPEPCHGDPADRILIATARDLGAKLVTADELILSYAKLGHVSVLN